MELITLLSLNLVFGMGLYIFLASKVNRIVRESQGSKLQDKIQRYYNLYLHESNTQLEILNNKTRGLVDLIHRSEKILGELRSENQEIQDIKKDIARLVSESKALLSKSPNHPKAPMTLSDSELPISQPSFYQESTPIPLPSTPVLDKLQKINRYRENEPTVPFEKKESKATDVTSGLLAELGKKVKGFIGMEEDSQDIDVRAKNLETSLPSKGSNSAPTQSFGASSSLSPSQRMMYSVEGNPFEDLDDEESVRDMNRRTLAEGSFLSTLQEALEESDGKNKSNKRRDEVTFSLESLLAELPASASKIDKVVFLLKKGYSHSEISELLDIGTREVSLIETVRLQKSRRV